MYAITAHDRALINEAIAAGAVRHIPLGVSGINWATNAPWPSVEEAMADRNCSMTWSIALLVASPVYSVPAQEL
jgi:hypothetical protein